MFFKARFNCILKMSLVEQTVWAVFANGINAVMGFLWQALVHGQGEFLIQNG
jgi:hypothetical protein